MLKSEFRESGPRNPVSWEGHYRVVVPIRAELCHQWNLASRPESVLEQSEQSARGLVRGIENSVRAAGEVERLRRQWIAELQGEYLTIDTGRWTFFAVLSVALFRLFKDRLSIETSLISWFKHWTVDHSMMVNREDCTQWRHCLRPKVPLGTRECWL